MTASDKPPQSDQKNTKPMVPVLDYMDLGVLEDFLLATAGNIERALRHMGAERGKDYTAMDLLRLAQPFALEQFQRGHLKILTPPQEDGRDS